MIYKDKHFYTTTQHIKYMIDIEKLNQVEINEVLREYWYMKNMQILHIMEVYDVQQTLKRTGECKNDI